MNNRLILTYSLIESLYDQGEDYLDCFWPFAVKALNQDHFRGYEDIRTYLKQEYELEIPLHVLSTVLKRAIRKDYVERKDKQYKLTDQGAEYLGQLETEDEVKRRINELITDLVEYYKQNDISISTDNAYNLMLSFLNRNIEPLIQCVNPSMTIPEFNLTSNKRDELVLSRYIMETEKKKPNIFKTFQDMVFGSVLSVVLHAEDSSRITEIMSKPFGQCEVYLDTNYVFSVLGMHSPEINEPAKELFELLTNNRCHLKVFDFTIGEICRVVNDYIIQGRRYPTTIRIDSIYSGLNIQGWTKTKAMNFITNIESILSSKNLYVQSTGILLNHYKADKELKEYLVKYKPLASSLVLNHDLAAIEMIGKLRRRRVRKIESAGSLFLSSDNGLSKFDFEVMGHKNDGTVCEVILDKLMTNILWLKDPKMKPPLKSIIAAHSRDLFVKRKIWDTFYESLSRLTRTQKVNDEQIMMLFYRGYIGDILAEFSEGQVGQITDEFTLKQIEEAIKFVEKTHDREVKDIAGAKDREYQEVLAKKEEMFVKRLKRKVSNAEKIKQSEWLNKIQQIKDNLRINAQIKAKGRILLERRVVVGIFAIPIIFCLLTQNLNALNYFIGVISSMVFIGGIVAAFSPFNWWKKRESNLVNAIYTKMLIETGIDTYKQ